LKSLALSFLQRAYDDPALIKTEDPHWLSHIRPVLAMHKPATYRLDKLYDELLVDNVLGEYNGEIITNEHLQVIYAILAKYNRSELLPKKMTQTLYPEYSAAVPIPMLAYKEHYGVEYKNWKLNHEFMTLAFMGTQLSDIVGVTRFLESLNEQVDIPSSNSEVGDQEYADSIGHTTIGPIDVFNIETQRDFRNHATENGFFKTVSYTGLKRYGPSHPLGSHSISKFYWCMLTQTWIFDPKIRHPNMITNLLDWDTPAEPLEEFTNTFSGFKVKGREGQDTSQGFKVGKPK